MNTMGRLCSCRSVAAMALALLWGASFPACIYQRYSTETPRSATEQLLVSGAIERAVGSLVWPDISGQKIAVETVALNESDAPYLQAAAEAQAGARGARIVSPEEAETVLLILAGSLGTASRESGFGIPSIPTPMGVSPEIPFARVLKQRGYARLRLIAFNQAGERTSESPPVLDRASFEIYSLLFLVVRRNTIYPGESLAIGID